EGEVGAERRGGAERSAQGSRESFLYGADAGGGSEGVGVTGLQPRLGGGAGRAGGSCPPEGPVGLGSGRLFICGLGFGGGGIVWYGGVRGDARGAGGLEGCFQVTCGEGHDAAGPVGESDRYHS